MKSQRFADILRLILEISFVVMVVMSVEMILLKILLFIASLLFVSVFVPKNERDGKGIPVRGNFKILTEVIMVLITVVLSFSLYSKVGFVFVILGIGYLYLSKTRFDKLKNIT